MVILVRLHQEDLFLLDIWKNGSTWLLTELFVRLLSLKGGQSAVRIQLAQTHMLFSWPTSCILVVLLVGDSESLGWLGQLSLLRKPFFATNRCEIGWTYENAPTIQSLWLWETTKAQSLLQYWCDTTCGLQICLIYNAHGLCVGPIALLLRLIWCSSAPTWNRFWLEVAFCGMLLSVSCFIDGAVVII